MKQQQQQKQDHTTNILTISNLNFTVRTSHLDKIKDSSQFKDMVEVGALMNAIAFCRDNKLDYQLATLQLDYYAPESGTIALTGGLLHYAMAKAEELAESYPNAHSTREMRGFVSSFQDYRPQQVIADLRPGVPFKLYLAETLSNVVPELYATPADIIFGERRWERPWVNIAVMVDVDEFWERYKAEKEQELPTIKAVIDCIADDFTIAAEEFIHRTAKDLGLTDLRQPKPSVRRKVTKTA